MRSTSKTARFLAFAGAWLALALAWNLVRPSSKPAGEAARPPAHACVGPLDAAAQRAIELSFAVGALTADSARDPVPLEVESGKTTDQGKIPEAGVPKKFVRVQGQLWRTGVLQEDVDLCFLRLDPTRAGDWDFTDEEGRFEVELTTGIYDVLEESTGQFLARVNVPEEAEAWVCDLVLP